MKTLIKILLFTLMSIIFSNEVNFRNDLLLYDNVSIVLRNGTKYVNYKIESIDKTWLVAYPYHSYHSKNISNQIKLRVFQIQYIKSSNDEIIYGKTVDIIKTKNLDEKLSNKQLLNNAGSDLVKYRSLMYNSVGLGIISGIFLGSGNTQTGAALWVISYILSIMAIHSVGEAGEKLEKVDIKE